MMVSQWINYFNPDTVLDCGCGMGHLVKAFLDSDVEATGFDISKYAIENTPHQTIRDNLFVFSITDRASVFLKTYDLVIAFDILEHLNDEKEVMQALKNMKSASKKNILISVPVIGDRNLENDPTHRIFKTKEEWIKMFEKAKLKLKETPDYFMFREQIFILEV